MDQINQILHTVSETIWKPGVCKLEQVYINLFHLIKYKLSVAVFSWSKEQDIACCTERLDEDQQVWSIG